MRLILFLITLLWATASQAQRSLPEIVRLTSDLTLSESAPLELLSSRSVVLFRNNYTVDELTQIQKAFQQIGIDAVLYQDVEKVMSGLDPERSFATYFASREIKFIILLDKTDGTYSFLCTEFNNTPQFVKVGQPLWKESHPKLNELLASVYRDSWLRAKKQNFLINDIPETEVSVPIIAGRRSELFPIDLRTDNIAVPKVGDVTIQAEVDTLMKKLYPYPDKYKIVTMPADEKDLVKQGFQFVILYVKCNGRTARELLGYNMDATSTAFGSVTFPNGSPQVKTISADVPIYKIYIKHIRSGNVFLGTKWDADQTLPQSLKNHLMGLRSELKLN